MGRQRLSSSLPLSPANRVGSSQRTATIARAVRSAQMPPHLVCSASPSARAAGGSVAFEICNWLGRGLYEKVFSRSRSESSKVVCLFFGFVYLFERRPDRPASGSHWESVPNLPNLHLRISPEYQFQYHRGSLWITVDQAESHSESHPKRSDPGEVCKGTRNLSKVILSKQPAKRCDHLEDNRSASEFDLEF